MKLVTYSYVLFPCIALFFGVLVMLEVGRRISLRQGEIPGGVSAINGAMLALMGLLIAFTFSGAMGRFDIRRDLVVKETNAIGTAWLRIASLPEAAQPALREAFRAYLDSRLEVYRRIPDLEATREAMAASARIQDEIWQLAVAATRDPEGQRALVVVLPAMNEMIDISTTRAAALFLHPPLAVFAMLFCVVLISALLAGYDISAKYDTSHVHRIVFALVAAVTVYVILDIEYGRVGLVRSDLADQFLIDLRARMG